MPALEVTAEGRSRYLWALEWASHVPSLWLFRLAARLTRFEYRIGGGRWRLLGTAYDLIDWDSLDDDDDGDGILIPAWMVAI